MRKFSVTRADLKRILTAGTIVAVLDGTFAFCAYVVVAGRYNFESLLQYTASGLLGNDAVGHHGLTGWLIAALGATLHFAISFTVAAVFFVALRRFARTSERTVALGLLYAAGVWMFNAGVVLPATGTRHEPLFGGWYIPFLVDHALFVGADRTRACSLRPEVDHEPRSPGSPSGRGALTHHCWSGDEGARRSPHC